MKESRIPKFRRCVLQNFPFIEEDFDALTDYELLCKVVEYLNKVIDHQNAVDEKIDGLVEGFAELKAYVDNYFENLDVQEEINNKLEEMAEGGDLAAIIAQFLTLAPVFAYETVAAMQAATNLINGCLAETYGFYTKGDGGSSKYIIRTKTEADSPDDMSIFALADNTLVAEKVQGAEINVKEYGAYGDGTHDDWATLQAILQNFKDYTIYFPQGTYSISDTLVIDCSTPHIPNIKLDREAILKASTSITALFNLVGSGSRNITLSKNYTGCIDGGTFDCTNADYGIFAQAMWNVIEIKNATFINISNIGVALGDSSLENHIGNYDLHNCFFHGKGSEYSTIGLLIDSSDNQIYDLTIDRVKTGIKANYGGNLISTVHATAMFGQSATNAQINATVGFDFSDDENINQCNQCYADTFGTGFKVHSQLFCNQCFTYWYLSNAETNFKSYEIVNMDYVNTKLSLSGCESHLPDNGTKRHVVITSTSTGGGDYIGGDNFNFSGCFWDNRSSSETDPAYCMSCNGESTVRTCAQDSVDLQANTYYVLAYLEGADDVFNMFVQYSYENFVEVNFRLDRFISKDVIQSGSDFVLSLINRNGKYILCASYAGNGKHKNFILSGVKSNGFSKVFAKETLFWDSTLANVNPSEIVWSETINE